MGAVNNIKFSMDNFKKAVQSGLFLPDSFSYSFVDAAKFEAFKCQQEWNVSKITDTFEQLRQRMSRSYFDKVILAQTCALDYAALQFPAYSMLITEDLIEDWLAIVDFHKKHSRDHSLHQPLTAYIAASLLGYGDSAKSLAIPASTGNLLDYCVDVIFTSKDAVYIREVAASHGLPATMLQDNPAARKFWKGLFYRAVVLSALFHDVGYPWQYIDRIGTSLKQNVNVLHSKNSIASNIINKFKDSMILLPLRHYKTNYANEVIDVNEELYHDVEIALSTHGFPGAIAFLSLSDVIRRGLSNHPAALTQGFIVEWASMGIFMHDMAGKYKDQKTKLRVDILQDPLSAIISFSDYLEEFERPKVLFRSQKNQSCMTYHKDCSMVKVCVDSDRNLVIEMKYINKTSKAIAARFKKEESDTYFNQGDGYVNLYPLGIKNIICKQK